MRFVNFILLSIGFCIFQSCKTAQKLQPIQVAIAKIDTSQRVIIRETPTIDSAAIVQGIINKLQQQKLTFTTFNAKIKVDYEGAEETQHFTAYLSLIKDSALYVQLVGSFLGITAKGMELMITKDSVTLIKEIGEKWVKKRSINYLQESIEIPFDFTTLQDIIVGNPVFLSNNINSYKSGNQTFLVSMIGPLFKHLLTLSPEDNRILHSKLDDVDINRNRTCDITFDNYVQTNLGNFATYRKISLAEKSKLDIYLNYKQFVFNEAPKYRVTIPKNYKKL